MGCDISGVSKVSEESVSIHAPRVGCDTKAVSLYVRVQKFQFTHPVWGATETV